MIGLNHLMALSQFGISAETIKASFPMEGFIFVGYDAEVGSVEFAQKVFSVNETFLMNVLQRQNISSHKILKYPFDPLESGFYFYCKYVAKITQPNDTFDNLYFTWVNEVLTDLEKKKRWGNFDYSVEFEGSAEQVKRFAINFIKNAKERGSALNILYAIDDISRQMGRNIFGTIISRAVRTIKIENFGILPYYENSKMKYLFGGLKGNFIDKQNYEEAKNMLRQGNDVNVIRAKTGWVLDMPDGRPRFIIPNSDAKWKADIEFLPIGNNGNGFVSKKGYVLSQEVINSFGFEFYNSSKIMDFPKLGDILEFPKLFELYPEFANVPVCVGRFISNSGQRGGFNLNPIFTISALYPESWIDANEEILATLIHEIQHAIQIKEGFTSGGNTSIATLIMATSTEYWREFNFLQEQFIELFVLRVTQNNSFNDFNRAFSSFQRTINEIIPDLSQKNIAFYGRTFSFVVLNLAFSSSELEFANFVVNLRSFLFENTGIDEEPVFNKYIESTKFVVAKRENLQSILASKGYVSGINSFSFLYYLSFGGEIESRYVASNYIQKVPLALQKVFKPISSENTINNLYIFDRPFLEIKSNFSYETKEGKGAVLHLEPSDDSYPIFHEIGHAVYDFLKQDNGLNEIAFIQSFQKQSESTREKGFNEFCADAFCSYLKRRKIESTITSKFKVEENVGEDLNGIFANFMNFEKAEEDLSPIIERYMQYLKEFLNDV
jgi:hypothetical protein